MKPWEGRRKKENRVKRKEEERGVFRDGSLSESCMVLKHVIYPNRFS